MNINKIQQTQLSYIYIWFISYIIANGLICQNGEVNKRVQRKDDAIYMNPSKEKDQNVLLSKDKTGF
jgi:hypothetical protein